eukprot:gene11603-24296_t
MQNSRTFCNAIQRISDYSELPLDDNGHLASHWLVFPDGRCGDTVLAMWEENDHSGLREVAIMNNDLAKDSLDYNEDNCAAICLERGTPASHINIPLPEAVFHEQDGFPLEEWYFERCITVEIGFISYHHNEAIINWISPEGDRMFLSDLKYGESNTFWTNSRLGHKFEILDSVTGEVIKEHVAEFNSFNPIGDSATAIPREMTNEDQEVRNMFEMEHDRFRRIKRTFTEFGFNKGRLPDDVWGSMQTYYYNNRNHYTREEYENKGFTVNWYEVDPKFLGMPWGLKRYWQSRLLDVVQKWIGYNIPIENTDIYGIRKYERGARLLAHVDREATHAVSLIVNIAQFGIRKPWMVEIYDHADRLHEIEMAPGDIVYYESAACLHGRATPLDGDYYVNLFTHYRPVGDPEWFLKPNPQGTPEPLIDITGVEVPTLSPKGHVVRGPNDLYDYWKMVAPPGKHDKTEL